MYLWLTEPVKPENPGEDPAAYARDREGILKTYRIQGHLELELAKKIDDNRILPTAAGPRGAGPPDLAADGVVNLVKCKNEPQGREVGLAVIGYNWPDL